MPDGWEVVRLGDVARERNQRANSTSALGMVISRSPNTPISSTPVYFNRQVISDDTENYKILHLANLAYATIHLA